MKLLLALPLALVGVLAGCANPIFTDAAQQTTLYSVNSAFVTAQEAALTYGRLPLCGARQVFTVAAPCHDGAAFHKIVLDEEAAKAALKDAKAAADANPNGVTVLGLLTQAQSLVDQMTVDLAPFKL